MQIEHFDWRINNASAEGWHAVHLPTGQVIGPFTSWQQALRAIKTEEGETGNGQIRQREKENDN